MKKVIIAMSFIAFLISSCNKQATILPDNSNVSQNDALQTDAIHYYHGKQVNSQQEISSYNAMGSAVIATDKINGKLEFYYFDNEVEELSFLNEHTVLKPLYDKLIQAIDLREYSITSGAQAEFATTGLVNADFTAYASKHKARGGYGVLSSLAGFAGAGIFVPIGAPIAVFPPWIDNLGKSYNSPAGQGMVFRNFFFAGGSFAIFATPGTVNFPILWRNIVSSAI